MGYWNNKKKADTFGRHIMDDSMSTMLNVSTLSV